MSTADKGRIKCVPHYDLIRENETISIRSVFDFKGGCEELFPFLHGCSALNCTVVFENENITVHPNGGDEDFTLNLQLSVYAMVAKNDKLIKDYSNYMHLLNM